MPPLLHRLWVSFILAALALTLSSCETPGYAGPGPRPAPRVLMPGGLSQNEARFVPEIEDALIRAGYRPTRDRSAEYALEFEVDDGPVNADTHLILYREGSEVARAYARVGGPRILLQRQEFIRQSFEKCLNDFEGQLGRSTHMDDWHRPDGTWRQTDRQAYDNPGYDQYHDSSRHSPYREYERPY